MSLIDTLGRVTRRLRQRRQPTGPILPAGLAGLTIVTPSYEGHYQQFARLIESIRSYCLDPQNLTYIVVVEQKNVDLFRSLFSPADRFSVAVMTTEDALRHFHVDEPPSAFLARVGKFTFQTVKKLAGLYRARTAWSLVLDSETIFLKPFRAQELLDDYVSRKYVFYSRTEPRGGDWRDSLGCSVVDCCAAALGVAAHDRWYMECFHWFYETDKLRDMVDHHLAPVFFSDVQTGHEQKPYFEVILYYLYLAKVHGHDYRFIDIFDELARHLPPAIARRYALAELPFSRFGNEYLLNVLAPDELHVLASFFSTYRLPFLRLEPPFISHRYLTQIASLPSACAVVSSQHMAWLRKPIAVCVADGFAADTTVLNAQLGELIGFLSGVECDIFVHGRADLDATSIQTALCPTASRFEDAVMLDDLYEQVCAPPVANGKRDRDDLSRLYSAEQCYDLIAAPDQYGYIVKLRAGMVGDLSLKEILIAISDNSDVLPGTIYLPRALHGRGVNVDLAIGPPEQMQVYMRTFSRIIATRADHLFDAQVSLLEALIEGGCRLALAEMAYADMQADPPGISATFDHFQRQFANWWGRNEDLPLYSDVTEYLASKLGAARAQLYGTLPMRFDARSLDGAIQMRVDADRAHPAARIVVLEAPDDHGAGDWRGEVFVAPAGRGVVLTRWLDGVPDTPIPLRIAK